MFLTCYVFHISGNMYSELREVKQELQSLQKQKDLFFPPADLKPNFASRIVGRFILTNLHMSYHDLHVCNTVKVLTLHVSFSFVTRY